MLMTTLHKGVVSLLWVFLGTRNPLVAAFSPLVPPTQPSRRIPTSSTISTRQFADSLLQQPQPLYADKWSRDIEEKSKSRASASGGETFAGAVLGGLLAGPFGAVFGATIGSSIGAKNAVNRAKQEEMARLGIDADMLLAAQDVAEALERANQGLATVQDSLSSLQRFARRLDSDANVVMEKAKAAVTANDEDTARSLLLERQSLLDKLKTTLQDCVDMKGRLEIMEKNVSLLETKAIEIETLLQRTVGAKAMQDVGALGLALDDEDPLLRKFRDFGID